MRLFATQRSIWVRLAALRTSAGGEAGRAGERERRVVLSFVAALGTRVVTVVTNLVAVPLMLKHLGQERYGVWLTLSSFLNYLTFADLGLGNGLLNAVSDAHGRDDQAAARRSISSAFFMLLAIAAGVGLLGLILFPHVSWPALFATRTRQAAAEAAPAALVFFLLFIVQMPLSIIQRINLGYQEAYINSTFQALGSLLGLGAVYLAVAMGLGLPGIVLAFIGAPILALVANWRTTFSGKHREARPVLRDVHLDAVRRLLSLGGLFLVLQIAGAIAFASDAIVAAQVLGPEAVTQLGVPARLFILMSSVVSIALLPLWPAYSEAIARGDLAWVNRTLAHSIKISVVVLVPCALLGVFLGKPILRWWAGAEVQPSFLLLAGLAAWTVVSTVGTGLAMVLNAANVVRFQVISATCLAIFAILAKVGLARLYGIEGIIWGMVLVYIAVTLVPYAWYVSRALPRDLQRLSKTVNAE